MQQNGIAQTQASDHTVPEDPGAGTAKRRFGLGRIGLVAALLSGLGLLLAGISVRAGTTALVFDVLTDDNFFSRGVLRATVGEDITVNLRNVGRLNHNIVFELEGGEVVETRPISTGQTASLSFQAPATSGPYEYYCSVDDHRSLGMSGTFSVRPQPDAVFDVEGGEFFFRPDTFEADPRDELRVNFRNGGAAPHNIVFELENGALEQSEILSGGQSQSMFFKAPMAPGEYAFYCSVGNHRDQGMEGTFTVRGPTPAPTPTETATPEPTEVPTEAPTEPPTATPEPTPPGIYLPRLDRS